MKTKSILKMLSTVVTTAMIAAAVAFPASASEFAYTPVNGDTTSFKKYLVMPETAEVPNITFDFEIAAGDAIPAIRFRTATIQLHLLPARSMR